MNQGEVRMKRCEFVKGPIDGRARFHLGDQLGGDGRQCGIAAGELERSRVGCAGLGFENPEAIAVFSNFGPLFGKYWLYR